MATAAQPDRAVNDDSTFVRGAEYQNTINNLMEMGFEREQVVKALRASFNHPDRAVEYLFSVRFVYSLISIRYSKIMVLIRAFPSICKSLQTRTHIMLLPLVVLHLLQPPQHRQQHPLLLSRKYNVQHNLRIFSRYVCATSLAIYSLINEHHSSRSSNSSSSRTHGQHLQVQVLVQVPVVTALLSRSTRLATLTSPRSKTTLKSSSCAS